MILSQFGFALRCAPTDWSGCVRFDLGLNRRSAVGCRAEDRGRTRETHKHVPSLARRQPCRSHVARAVESRAFWRVSRSFRRWGWESSLGSSGARRPGSVPSAGAAAVNEQSPLAVLNEGLRTGDPQVLALHPQAGHARAQRAPSGPERARCRRLDRDPCGLARRLSHGSTRPGRATAVTAACLILDKFAVEPAPGSMGPCPPAGSRPAYRQSR